MAQRMGRPKADNPKSVIVKARIDEGTNNRLQAYCKRNGATPTDVLRKGIALVLAQEKKSNRG